MSQLILHRFSNRTLNGIGFLACTFAMAFAYYLQYVHQLEPCSMCMLQRFAMVALGMCFLIPWLTNPGLLGQKIFAGLALVFAVIGEVLAGRHVWLQHLPEDKVPACGPNWDYMVDVLPFTEIVATIMKGAGECAEISWQWLGLSIPEQLLIGFSLLIILVVVILIQSIVPAPNKPME